MENCELNNCTITIHNDSEARRTLDKLRKDLTRFSELADKFKDGPSMDEEEKQTARQLINENDRLKHVLKKTFD